MRTYAPRALILECSNSVLILNAVQHQTLGAQQTDTQSLGTSPLSEDWFQASSRMLFYDWQKEGEELSGGVLLFGQHYILS